MTREEKEHIGKYVLELAKLLEDGCYQQEILLGAAHIIDEALEQEPILDKIRAEIAQEIIPRNSDQYDHEAMWQNCGLRMALKIIDKYKAESEDKE